MLREKFKYFHSFGLIKYRIPEYFSSSGLSSYMQIDLSHRISNIDTMITMLYSSLGVVDAPVTVEGVQPAPVLEVDKLSM